VKKIKKPNKRQIEHKHRVISKRLVKQQHRVNTIMKIMGTKGISNDLLIPLSPTTCCNKRTTLILSHTNIAGGSVASVGACGRCSKRGLEYFQEHNTWPKEELEICMPLPCCVGGCSKRLLVLPFEVEKSPSIIVPKTDHDLLSPRVRDVPRRNRPRLRDR